MFQELSACDDLFTRFGGHKMAAGFSLAKENVGELQRRLNENCSLTEEDFIPKVHIDVALPLSRVTEEFIQELEYLEPFGTGNRKPVFAQKNICLCSGRIFGKNQNVAKFRAQDEDGHYYTLVTFREVQELKDFLVQKYGKEGEKLFSAGGVKLPLPLTITYYPQVNEYQGNRNVEFVITDYCITK